MTTTAAAPRTDRLELVKELPRGTIGIVHKAKSPQQDRLVALRKFEVPQWLDDVNDLLKRIMTEARAASALDHPNIARLYTCGYKDFTVFMTSEFVDGQSLKELMASRQPEMSEVLKLARQLGAALDCAHDKGVFHHFLNPSNIKVAPDGTLKVLDFGLLRHKDLLSHTPAKKLENEPYLSPEQVKNKQPDRAANLFSAAAIIYQMYTARSPFAGKHLGEVDRSITELDPHPLNVAHPRVPEAISKVVRKALSKNPADRFLSGQELFTALEAAAKAEPARPIAPGSARNGAQNAPTASSSPSIRIVPSASSSQSIRIAPSASSSQSIRTSPGTSRVTPPATTARKPVSTANHWKLVVAVVGGLFVVVALAMIFQRRPAEVPTESADVRPEPPKARASSPVSEEPAAVNPRPTEQVQPRPGRAAKTHRVEAAPAPVAPTDGLLAITSFPEGATVEIEGRGAMAGKTPLMAGSLLAGVYKVTVSRPGYAPEVRSVQVAAGNRTSLDVRLNPVKGFITVTGSPAGASVFINGKDTGKVTPAEFTLDPAVQRIVVRKAGYLDASSDIKLVAGQSVSYAPSLMVAGRTDNIKVVGGMGKLFGSGSPQGMARIEIKTEPKGAQVIVNGSALAKTTPLEIQVEAGNYDITIQKDGYKSYHENAIVGMEDRVRIDKILTR